MVEPPGGAQPLRRGRLERGSRFGDPQPQRPRLDPRRAALPDTGRGQAQFISVQGSVSYRGATAATGRRRAAAGRSTPATTCAPPRTARPRSCSSTAPSTPCARTPSSSSRRQPGAGGGEQTIAMEYGWVDLNTAQSTSSVKTPRPWRGSSRTPRRSWPSTRGPPAAVSAPTAAAWRCAAKGGLTRRSEPLQQVVQTRRPAVRARAAAERPERWSRGDNRDPRPRAMRAGSSSPGTPVPGAGRYALQISRNHLFVDNVIDVENRTKTRATLGLRGEGTLPVAGRGVQPDGLQGPVEPAAEVPRRLVRGAAAARTDTTPPELDLEQVSKPTVVSSSSPGAASPARGSRSTASRSSPRRTAPSPRPSSSTKDGWSFIEIRARDAVGQRDRPPPPRLRRKSVETPLPLPARLPGR